MRLLVTNDDGVDSPFFQVLVRALLAAGHDILVAAPKQEQSWIGAAKSRARPVHSVRAEKGLGCPTWVVDGTPSDCVNIAIGHLIDRPVDGVVSGINIGLNTTLGFILASGTIAGAWEGALHGLPAFACSQEVTDETYEDLKSARGGVPDSLAATLAVSARHAARMAPVLLGATGRNRFVVHNVNFPLHCADATEVRRTVPARLMVPGLFSPRNDEGTHRLIFSVGEDVSPPELPSDRAAIAAGLISHTVLDYTALGR
ncbi:MAG TPA: 5'/3'-nucleotidase SurE [Opitutaceae bacterium]|nr:5'/3'-nucleotidase SurE [Opitutaceae bacterium]